MLYVGVDTEGTRTRLYVSSVSSDSEHFESNAVFIELTRPAAYAGDTVAISVELNILRNVLTSGGAQVIVEVS